MDDANLVCSRAVPTITVLVVLLWVPKKPRECRVQSADSGGMYLLTSWKKPAGLGLSMSEYPG